MEVLIVFGQMAVLFAMMAIGYIVYRKGWVDDKSSAAVNKLVVNIFNPLLIISSAIGKDRVGDKNVMAQNAVFVVIYFVFLFLIGILVVKLLRTSKHDGYQYRMMLAFSNMAFMGIPVIRGVLGNQAVLLLTFYIMGFNILIYTLGIRMARLSNPSGGKKEERSLGRILKDSFLNTGVLASLLAVILYFSGLILPAPFETFINYMGNTTIPLSMMAIGFSLAGMQLREILGDWRVYAFTAVKMLGIPILSALLLRVIPYEPDEMVKKVFLFMLSMPVGSMVPMICQIYGGDQKVSSKGTVLTTLVSLISIPVVTIFF